MNETDYWNASNLARLRMCEHSLRAIVPDDGAKDDHQAALASVQRMVERYEKKVDPTPPKTPPSE